nr:LOB domain-containing protein 24-like [Ipomoea batatas]
MKVIGILEEKNVGGRKKEIGGLMVKKIEGRSLIALLLPNFDVVDNLWLEPFSWEQVEEYKRGDVAESLYYEAQCRVENPVYGCVGIITLLQQEIYNFESQLAKIEAQIRLLKAQGATPSL